MYRLAERIATVTPVHDRESGNVPVHSTGVRPGQNRR